MQLDSIELTTVSVDAPDRALQVAGADEVLQDAYGVGRPDRIVRFIEAAPSAWVMARDLRQDGRVVATGGAIAYPDGGFGWIGLVGTRASERRRGLGRLVTAALVDYLRTLGCSTALDASDDGAPVYSRMGFQDAGLTHVMLADSDPPPSAHEANVLDASSLEAVLAYDRERFGADRSRLLRGLISSHPERVFTVSGATGIRGYAIAQGDMIGPIVADDPEVLHALVAATAALHAPPGLRILLPAESAHRATLEALGFSSRRSLRHQRLGLAVLPGRRGLLAGQLSLGEG